MKDEKIDESNEESAINPSQISTPGKQVFPAISYWVACQTQNGSAVNPMKIQRALGKCGLEFYLSRASRKKNSHDLNQLCQVLKDHKNPCLMNFVEASYQHCLRLVYSMQNCYSKGYSSPKKSTPRSPPLLLPSSRCQAMSLINCLDSNK